MQKKGFYITTPIYYVNDTPHIGHAYTTLACDVIARYKRLDGYDVMFLTGTDEHGQKIERAAKKAGITPQAFTDKFASHFLKLAQAMNFSNDDFIRTSESRHKSYVSNIWARLLDSGNVYLGKYSGWYSIRDEAFYDASELIDGKAPTGASVEWLEESSYFFKLSAWQEKLLAFYERHPDFIAPSTRRNEVISFVKGGLTDLSISRTSFSWGIPVPRCDGHVIYVWLDALFNYLSAIGGEGAKYWPCDLHIVGKDILRFHAVYWPAFLMALDIELPKRVFAHGWWTNEGEKISKSLGNTIDPLHLIETFGLDYVRYFMMKEVSFGRDGNYSSINFINRVNSELVNSVGNLIQRTLTFIYHNCDGMIPAYTDVEPQDEAILEKAYGANPQIRKDIESQVLHAALQVIIDLADSANEYITKQAPWQLKKNGDIERMNTVLCVLADVIRVIGILLQPFVPESAKKILDIMNVKDRELKHLDMPLSPGHQISAPFIVFHRIAI